MFTGVEYLTRYPKRYFCTPLDGPGRPPLCRPGTPPPGPGIPPMGQVPSEWVQRHPPMGSDVHPIVLLGTPPRMTSFDPPVTRYLPPRGTRYIHPVGLGTPTGPGSSYHVPGFHSQRPGTPPLGPGIPPPRCTMYSLRTRYPPAWPGTPHRTRYTRSTLWPGKYWIHVRAVRILLELFAL